MQTSRDRSGEVKSPGTAEPPALDRERLKTNSCRTAFPSALASKPRRPRTLAAFSGGCSQSCVASGRTNVDESVLGPELTQPQGQKRVVHVSSDSTGSSDTARSTKVTSTRNMTNVTSDHSP